MDIFRFSRSVFKNVKCYITITKQNLYNGGFRSGYLQKVTIKYDNQNHSFSLPFILNPIGLLGFSFFSKEDKETPEDKLIMTIKRSILAIQRKEYDKAEQMLHLALRMAQDLQHKDGVTYVYDILANLAMERGQFKNAEQLFAEVMKRLIANGENEDSLKILHMSSKIAHMAHLQDDFNKAAQGFKWTLDKIRKLPNSENLKEIEAITCDWYGQMLVEQQSYIEAKKCFQEAFDFFIERYGETYTELVPILNNLAVAALGLNDTKSAREYLKQALEIIKKNPEATNEGVLQANLGLVYLRDGLVQQAKMICAYAYKLGKNNKNDDSVKQANYCLDEVKKIMNGHD